MPDTLADRIRECLSEWIAEHGTEDCGGPCAVTSSVVALRTVLSLHQPTNSEIGPLCQTCGSGEPHEYPEPWPCDTVRAIAAPLGIKEES